MLCNMNIFHFKNKIYIIHNYLLKRELRIKTHFVFCLPTKTHSVFDTLFVYGCHSCGRKSPLLEKQARMFGLE